MGIVGIVKQSLWIGVGIAAAVLAGVAIVALLWATIGSSDISFKGWLAMIFGVIAMLAVGIGLMSLVFFSSRHGYDDDANPRR
jgi:hypothetical protein